MVIKIFLFKHKNIELTHDVIEKYEIIKEQVSNDASQFASDHNKAQQGDESMATHFDSAQMKMIVT